MAKKNKVKAREPIAPEPANATIPSSPFNTKRLIPVFACLLYFAVHFIPDFGSYDNMGSQWLYIVGIDFLVTFFILARKNDYQLASSAILGNIFSKLYLAFFVLAGISTFTAINQTESWVCFVRLIATIIAFFNISILLYGRTDLFKILAQLLGLILLVESIQAIGQFFNGIADTDLSGLILSLKGTTGNKNIFAASTVVKIPFVIYCIHTFKLWGRIVNIVILVLAALTIFIVNARASFLSIIFITLLYIIYCILGYVKDKKINQTLYRVSYVIIPILAAAFISQIVLTNVKNLQEAKGGYGTVTDRLASAASFNAEDNQVRIRLWTHALDYTSKHPVMGCGYGNWKIASIPYQKAFINDLVVPVHAHNDYVEMFAELGVAGGLLYLGLFFSILLFTIKVYRSSAAEETKLMSLFSFLAFIGYAIDAFFNFPMERPVSQVFFAFITSINIVAYINACKVPIEDNNTEHAPGSTKTVFGLLAILFLLPAGYVTYLTYKSLVAQKTIIPDLDNEPLKLKWNEIIPQLPSIPNISASGQPLEAIEGRYLYEAGKYEEALVLLNRAGSANPVIAYSEFLKAGVFYRQGKMDSSFIYASKAFYTKPRAKTYYQTFVAIMAKQKDTINIQKAFEEAIQYRKEPYVWNLYILGLLNAQGKGSPKLLTLTDSALQLFPGNAELLLRRREIMQFMGAPVVTKNAVPIDYAKAQTFYDAGIVYFNKAQAAAAGKDETARKEGFASAASHFLKAAAINPENYIVFENAAISFFNMKEYNKSLTYFNKVMAMKTAVDGKTEYFAGVALYNLGKKNEACHYLTIALLKGWKEAAPILQNNCK